MLGSLKYPDFKCLKKRGFRINELSSQMGFYFQMKKSLGILEIDD
jgi:hypothetical protein